MAKILIKNGRAWDGNRFLSADVLTDGNRIIKVESDITEKAEFVYDASGKIVSAGLVDAHVHMKGISNKTFGIQAEMSCFPFGVTAACDAGGGHGDRSLLDSFMLKNVVLVTVGFRDNKACFDSIEEKIEKFGEKAIGIKVYFDTQLSDIQNIAPLCEIVEFAEKNDLIVMVHSSNSPVAMKELLGTLRKGDILTHAYHGGDNNISEDGFECIKAAKERGVIIDAGFAGHVHTDFKVLKGAFDIGAFPDTISTDITRFSAYTRGGRYGMTMCMSIARSLGMREEEIFKSITSTPARALGKDGEWGYLKVGSNADIAVFDYTDEGFDLTDKAGNRIYSDKGYRCVLTVSDGQVVYRD